MRRSRRKCTAEVRKGSVLSCTEVQEQSEEFAMLRDATGVASRTDTLPEDLLSVAKVRDWAKSVKALRQSHLLALASGQNYEQFRAAGAASAAPVSTTRRQQHINRPGFGELANVPGGVHTCAPPLGRKDQRGSTIVVGPS